MSLEADALALGLTQRELHDLKRRYSEPQRHYHTWEHLLALYAAAEDVDWHDHDAARLAILYYDAVYAPGSKINDADSADLLLDTLRGRIDDLTLHRAEHMIRWTAEHALPSDLPPRDKADAQHFLDIDMGILGAPRPVYARYARQVRKEYRRIPALLYNRGRAMVLAEFLRRPRLYLSDHFHRQLDATARSNIRWELADGLGRAGRRAVGSG